MKITLIGCPFRNFYSGMYIDALRGALERTGAVQSHWVAAHCGCEDPIGLGRVFQTRECDYFEMRQIKIYRSGNPVKRALRYGLRDALYARHAARYAKLSEGAELVHFHQIANAFGSSAVFHWLKHKRRATRVVTVHELDDEQLEIKARNRAYALADALIVHCEEMREKLCALDVPEKMIHVLPHGTHIVPLTDSAPRAGIVFYGGHHLMRGKNIETLFEAYALLAKRLKEETPRLIMHGQWGPDTPEEGLRLAERCGIGRHIDWRNTLDDSEVTQLYRRAAIAVLPFSTSFAGWPIGFVAANALPLIATRNGGIPDHIGENAVWVKGDDPSELSDRIRGLLSDGPKRHALGLALRQRAEDVLDWNQVAQRTLALYRALAENRAAA